METDKDVLDICIAMVQEVSDECKCHGLLGMVTACLEQARDEDSKVTVIDCRIE